MKAHLSRAPDTVNRVYFSIRSAFRIMLDSLNNDAIFTLTSPSIELMNTNSQLPQKPVMMSIEDGEEIVVVEPTDPDEDRLKQTLVVPGQEAVSTSTSQTGILNSSRNGVYTDPVVLSQLIQVLNGRVTTENTSQAPRLLVASSPSVLSLQTTPTNHATPHQASFMVQPLSGLQATQLLNLSSAQPVSSPLPNFLPTACLRGLISADPMLYGVVVNCSTAAMITQIANHVSTSMLNLAQQCSIEGNANMCLQITEINQLLGVLISLASSMSTSLPGLLSLRGNANPQPLVSSISQTNPILTSLISSTSATNQPVNTAPAVSSPSETAPNAEAPSNADYSQPCPIQVKPEPSPSSVSSGKQSPPVAGMLTMHGKVLKSVKTHSRPKRHGCPFSGCTRAFTSRYNLVEHIRIHTGERPFVCPVAGCTSRFKRRRDLYEHSAMHEDKNKVHALISSPGKMLLVTSVIPEQGKSERTVNGSSRGRHFCPFPNCNSSYARRHRLNQHMCKHTGVGPFYCDHSKCTMRFFNAEDLKHHKIVHSFPYHIDKAKNHICMFENCGKVYPKMNKLLEHIRSHTGERPYTCNKEGCNASFSRQYGLRRHLLTHSSTSDAKIENAEVPTSAKPGLITSAPLMARTTTTSSTPVFSQTTGLVSQATPKPQTAILNLFQALTSSPVQLHQNVGNATNAEPAQDSTNAAPTRPDSDLNVISVATTNQTLTLSSVTSQPKSKLPLVQRSSKAAATPSASALAEKALVVTCAFGKRRHVCPIENCQKVFPKLNKLREHICRHTGERPYACEECTATFVRMYDLRRHAQIHTRKKAGILNNAI